MKVKLGTEHKIVLTHKDLEANFNDPTDCPLNRAVRRRFNWRYKVNVNFNKINLKPKEGFMRGLDVKAIVLGDQYFQTRTFMPRDFEAMCAYARKFPAAELSILLEESKPGWCFLRY